MFKNLIKAIERVAIAQEEANRLNKEFMEYRYEQDRQAEQYAKKVNEQNHQQNEEMMGIIGGNLQTALDRNNDMMVNYIDQRLGVKKTDVEENSFSSSDW